MEGQEMTEEVNHVAYSEELDATVADVQKGMDDNRAKLMKKRSEEERMLPVDPLDLYPFATCRTRKQRQYFQRDVVAAALVTQGNLGRMAKLIGRPRAGVDGYVKNNPAVAAFIEDIKQTLVDEAETQLLLDAATGEGVGNSQAAKFVLSTIGKNRGYSTRIEHTGKDDGPHSGPLTPLTRRPWL